MKRVFILRELFSGWTALWLVGALVAMTGCGSLPKAEPAGVQSQARGPDTEAPSWAEGKSALQRGDYRESARIFESLSKSAATAESRRRSLYALACTRLLMAQTPGEFSSAWNLWELWSQTAPAEMDEDPRLLAPLLLRLASPFQAGTASVQPAAPAPGSPGKSGSMGPIKVIKDKECEKQLRESDKEIQRMQKQIKTLRHQIEALETIHRKIQEKKKEVSSP
jgi:hypothetical protein